MTEPSAGSIQGHVAGAEKALPPLPKPYGDGIQVKWTRIEAVGSKVNEGKVVVITDAFSAEQMRAYALAAIGEPAGDAVDALIEEFAGKVSEVASFLVGYGDVADLAATHLRDALREIEAGLAAIDAARSRPGGAT